MSILTIILAIVVAGVLLWVINTYIPMSAGIKKLLNIVVIIILVLWLLRVFGILDSLEAIKF